jgi:hypothetical protein
MFIRSKLVQKYDSNYQGAEKQTASDQDSRNFQELNPEGRRKEEMILPLQMKNRKKFTHLYQLEKYFR